jgi:hypothetical protein
MRLVLEIEIDNDEFVTGTFERSPQAVVSAAERGLQSLLDVGPLQPGIARGIRDLNGNKIGLVEIRRK